MSKLADYQAAKARVKRFRGVADIWGVWGGPEFIRADLNTIAAHEAGQVEQAPQVPQIDARTLMMAHVMGGLMAQGYSADAGTVREAVYLTDAALSALKVNHD